MRSGVYKIQNVVDGKMYIGSAVNIEKRRREHRLHLKLGTHCNQKLLRAWNKYGPESFVFETLLICSKENLLMYEQLCIDSYDAVKNGYNIQPTAGSPLGSVPTLETRQKISKANTGKKVSEETKAKLALCNTGKKHSDEAKAKCSAASKGRVHSEETLKRMSLAQKGKVISREQRNLYSELFTGRKLSEETKEKMSASRTGKPRSPEARANISAGRLKKFRKQEEFVG